MSELYPYTFFQLTVDMFSESLVDSVRADIETVHSSFFEMDDSIERAFGRCDRSKRNPGLDPEEIIEGRRKKHWEEVMRAANRLRAANIYRKTVAIKAGEVDKALAAANNVIRNSFIGIKQKGPYELHYDDCERLIEPWDMVLYYDEWFLILPIGLLDLQSAEFNPNNT